MDGCGPSLEHLIKQQLAQLQPNQDYTIVEIGSAGCVTLRAFKDIVTESGTQANWRVLGFDLPPGKAWSLDMDQVGQAFDGQPCIVDDSEIDILDQVSRSMLLFLLEDPRTYLKTKFPFGIDFCFVDGSHGISAGKDFLAIEKKIAPGGLVVFHDYGIRETGEDWQTEDREFISVRSYVHRLGLANPCNVPRKGWRFVGEIKGSRATGMGDGNSAAVIQRTEEPLEYQPELTLDNGLSSFWDAHAEWSTATFGTTAERGPLGPLKHLAKEVVEVQADPTDITEFADIGLLWFDSARRAGFAYDQLIQAMWTKLAVNKTRQWGKAGANEAAEHIR